MLALAMVLVASSLMQACSSSPYQQMQDAAHLKELQQARALIGPTWPQQPDSRLTTSGEIYVGNLEGQIEAMHRLLVARPSDDLLARLARTHYHMFQVTGRLEDAVEARTLLSSAYHREHGPEVDLVYAEVLAGFHEFNLALEVLEKARENGADSGSVSAIQVAIQRDIDLLEENVSESVERTPTALVARAQEQVSRGQIAAASRLLIEAQDSYQNTNPYVLAWIHVQQGIVFLRYRDYLSARVFFTAAHKRLPQYAVATEHLAETELALGNYIVAAELYGLVAEQSGNPEFYFQLANAERAQAKDEAAGRYEQLARDGYKTLLDRYPLMYADHGARYYMAVNDFDTALRLAEMNIAARKNLRARTLLIEANQEAGNLDSACEDFAALRKAGFASPELLHLAPVLQRQCGR